MHELSVTESILNLTLKHAAQNNAHRVTDLYLVIGELASIVDDSVQFYWDIISQDTPAQGAQLHFRRIPAELTCSDCGSCYRPGDELACPQCGGLNVQVTSGDQFFLDSIEVE